MKPTLENLRGSVEKLSPKECVEGAHTVLKVSVRAPEGFSDVFFKENTKGLS